jgi:hypothetical protein
MSEPVSSWRVAEASAAWRPAAGDLPDVNVWLSLSYTHHPCHKVASKYWQDVCEAGTSIWFCRTTMMGLVRLLVQPSLMGADVMSLSQAWTVYQKWMAAPGVDLLPDPPGLESAIARVLAARTLPVRMWTDLCLAATAQAAGLRLVSFDRDFGRLNLERCLILQEPRDLGSGAI